MDTRSKSREQQSPELTDGPGLWQSAFKRSEGWMTPTFAAVEDVQAAAQRWMIHRLEDFQKAVDAAREMAECKDFARAAAVQQKWLADCTQRLVADWTALVAPASKQTSQPDGDAKKAAE